MSTTDFDELQRERDKRAAYTSGLRKLADLLDQHDDVPLPDSGSSSIFPVEWLLYPSPAQRAEMAAIARALPEISRKGQGHAEDVFQLTSRIDGLHVRAMADRQQVCERVVVGTREVTETVPDPDVEVPTIEVTKTVEDVEWRCAPVLAGADQ